MTRKDLGKLVGVILIFVCVLYTEGVSAAWNMIMKLADAFAVVGEFLLSFTIQFRDELGITDWLWTRGVYMAISVVLIAIGCFLTTRQKQRLIGVISAVVGLISAALTFAS